MKSLRTFAYAAVLTVSALNFAPCLASAQDEGGTFKLAHEVGWQEAVVPAGEYRFSLQAIGPLEMLTLTKITGKPASFMLFAKVTEDVASSKTARLVIDSRSGKTFVSAMDLPQFEVTLHFAAPANSGKEEAELHAASAAMSAR